MPITDVYGNIIWSADVSDGPDVTAKLDRINKTIRAKLDRLFMRRNAAKYPRLRDELKERGVDVFNDAKLIEIPSKLEELAVLEIELTRPWMLNCMAGAISNGVLEDPDPDKVDGLRRFAKVCLAEGVEPCAVTVLTSKTDEVVRREFNERSPIQQVLLYMEFLAEFGFTHVVCSPKELKAIRERPEYDGIKLTTPGVRMPGDATGDQARVATPGEARRDGANYGVIGRPITNADDPANVVELIAQDWLRAG